MAKPKPKTKRAERDRRAAQAAREEALSSGRAFLRPADLASRWGTHRITLHRWVQAKRLSPPVRLGPNVVGWPLATIEAFERAQAIAS